MWHGRYKTKIVWCLLFMVTAAFLRWSSFSPFVRAEVRRKRVLCRANMCFISAAAETWVMENRAAAGAHVGTNDILRYMAGGSMRDCPEHGQYTIMPYFGQVIYVVCSVHGDLMNQ